MRIERVEGDRRRYMDLLLLADEDERMVAKYLTRGDMFVLHNDNGDTAGAADDSGATATAGRVCAECVVTDEGDGVLEIKNLAVAPAWQRRGYGRMMIRFVEERYRGRYRMLQVGTGDSPLTAPFYKRCGFTEHHRVKDFFPDNYDHPIVECGVLLTDMVYFAKPL
ncbi:GNAT family N-acetyltransferase [Bifidobacterium samirii]|uniref:GNAT family N-acetyltransferase n=1 Tax=Bifidobacterium samirii TaxID=2306974 RepID=A0A430FNT2_9BIFI|nr:GNAT family N-acetyltransferase [Bifidobacterium samirii]RSX54485.1 GNAT family N-acetyltransferase [Bifidobacterium samirii]